MKELNALIEAAKEAVKDLRTDISSTVTVGDVVANRLKIAIATAEAAAKPVKLIMRRRALPDDGYSKRYIEYHICPKCKKRVYGGEKLNFCPKCGTPIDHE